MPDLEARIFSAALIVFLLTGAAKLTIEQLISLVILLKKLKATMKGTYSLESGRLEVRALERDELSKGTDKPQTETRPYSRPDLEVNPPVEASVDSTASNTKE